MKVLVIGNPIAGGGEAREQIEELEREIAARGHAVEVFLTGKAGDGGERAGRLEDDVDRLVVVVGDGALNEILNGLEGASTWASSASGASSWWSPPASTRW